MTTKIEEMESNILNYPAHSPDNYLQAVKCLIAVRILAKFAEMSVDDFLDRVFEDHYE
jgi:hypothetical protein